VKKPTKKKWIYRSIGVTTVLGIGLIFDPQSAKALFGFGDVVFDPSSYAVLGNILKSNADSLTKTVQLLTQTAKIAVDARRTADLVEGVVDHFENKDRWLTGVSQAGVVAIPNRYGESVDLNRALNGDYVYALASGARLWEKASEPLPVTPNLPDGNARLRLLAQIATAELSDAVGVNCAQIISGYRFASLQNQEAFEKLRADQASGGSNSQTRQTNMMNAAAGQQLGEARSANSLQVCLAEQQMVSNKRERDQIVHNLTLAAEMQQSLSSMSEHLRLPSDMSLP
jgi:type IV secretion system protein TrbJ